MEYWKTHKKPLIMRYLSLAIKNRCPLVIWQQVANHRVQFQGHFSEVSREVCKIKLSTAHNQDYFRGDQPFYVHIQELDVIFKKDNYNRMGIQLEFTRPSDIQVYERRKTKRYTYMYQDHKNVTFSSWKKDPKTGLPVFTYSSVLVDISTKGVGIVVSRSVAEKLEKGMALCLVDLTDQTLPDPFKVKIEYIESYTLIEDDVYKVGIQFDDELNEISYKSISSIIEIKQKKAQGLRPDQYCGIDEEQQVQLINKVEGVNRILAANLKDNIEYLDKLRYLTTQMKIEVLQTLNHDLLAVALRLSSKELIYELFSEVTTTMQDEFLEKLQTEKPASAVCKAQDDIIKTLRGMESRGEIVLDPKAFTTYV